MAFERFNAAPQRINYSAAAKAWIRVLKNGAATLNVSLSGVLASNFEALSDAHVQKRAGDGWCEVFVGTEEDAGKIELRFCHGPGMSDEAIKPGSGVHGLRRFTMRCPGGLPAHDTNTEACVIVSRDPDGIVLELPIELWGREKQMVSRAPAKPSPPGPVNQMVSGAAQPHQPNGPPVGKANGFPDDRNADGSLRPDARAPSVVPEKQMVSRAAPTVIGSGKANGSGHGHEPTKKQMLSGSEDAKHATLEDGKLNVAVYLAKKGRVIERTPNGWQMGQMILPEAEVLAMVNGYRADAGLRALTARDLV